MEEPVLAVVVLSPSTAEIPADVLLITYHCALSNTSPGYAGSGVVVATVTRAMCGTSLVHFLESYFYNSVDNT